MDTRVRQGFFFIEVIIALFVSTVGGLVLFQYHGFINKKMWVLEERKKIVWVAEQSLMHARLEANFDMNQPALLKEDWERLWVITPFIDACQKITVNIISSKNNVSLDYILCSPEQTRIYR